MNLSKLFEIQKELDAEIEKKHPTVPGEDRLAKRILALQVELGECANEWRGFKFWSMNQEPRTSVQVPNSEMDPLNIGLTVGWKSKNPLLEEYVDCLHFILSIGIHDKSNADSTDYHKELQEAIKYGVTYKGKNITTQFINIYFALAEFEARKLEEDYIDLMLTFIRLSEMLGFTWEQVETAYLEKNKINHERQAKGY